MDWQEREEAGIRAAIHKDGGTNVRVRWTGPGKDGYADPQGRCAFCGAPRDWNPGAGQNLCARHWDSY